MMLAKVGVRHKAKQRGNRAFIMVRVMQIAEVWRRIGKTIKRGVEFIF
jgi:hypothetical protein